MYCREVVEVVEKKKRFRGCSGRDPRPDKCISPSPPLPHLAPAAPFAVPPPPPPLAPLSSCPHCFDPRPLPPPPEHFFPRHETRRIPLLGKKTPFSRISARWYPRRAARCFSMSPIVPPAPNSQLASSAGKES